MPRRKTGFDHRYEKAKARGEVVSRAELRSREKFENDRKAADQAKPISESLIAGLKACGVDE
jgi:hypothetical protein